MKERLINKITLLDTSIYRCMGKYYGGVYSHEPIGYRNRLKGVYEKLEESELKILLNLKTKRLWKRE